jgi:predicted nuclease with TOPRIM domain
VKRVTESARASRNAKLEALVKSQNQKIVKLEAPCADLNCKKENVMISYRRLSDKHTTLAEKVEQEKTELAEAHLEKLAKVKEELDQETQGYTNYHLNVRGCLRQLHEVVASTFSELWAQCLPFLAWNLKVEELINWVVGEVKTVPTTMW